MISYTVEQALTLPCLEAARVVAGLEGVGRAVEGVGVLDVTDFEGVQPHQLVLSNAYPLLNLDLADLIERLDQSRAAGLALKLSEYWSEVPNALVEAADEVSFPVLLMPEGPFDEIVNPLLTAIAGHQLETLRESMVVHDGLTQAALREEGDPSSVAHILAQALHRPAAIFTDSGELLGAAGDEDGWGSDELIGFLSRGVTGGVIQVGGVGYYLASAPAGGSSRAIVCVRDVDPSDTLTRSAIAHAAVVAGMLLVGRQQVEQVYRKYERELFEDLTEGRPVQPEDARSRASRIGWPLQRPYLVLVAGRTPSGKGNGSAFELFGEGDLLTLKAILRDCALEGRVFLRPPGVGVVVHLRPHDNPVIVASTIAAELAGTKDSPWHDSGLVLGVGRPRRDVTGLAEAFAEAKLALRFRQINPVSAQVAHFADLGAVGLLSLTRDPQRLLKVAHEILGPLAGPGPARRGDLLATLRTLLARNMNLRLAADELFFHYNTVRHRASRLRSLLGDELDDPRRRLLLSLAVATIELYDPPAVGAGALA
ncbi:MAG: PucR family transcriptional regulator [Actinomycetota bacterium]